MPIADASDRTRSFYASLTERDPPARLLLVNDDEEVVMRWRNQRRSWVVLLALGGCAQDHPAHPPAPDGSQGADGSLGAPSRGVDAFVDVDVDEPRSASSHESVADPMRHPRSPSARPRVAAGVAIAAPTHAEAVEEPSVVTPRDEVAASAREAMSAPQGPADREREIVGNCARLRSLPSWCVERERARVRKRGTP